MRRPIARDINQRKRAVGKPVFNWSQPVVSSWLNFNPLSLSPVVWFDAADTSTITASSGAVSQWNDKSGNGYNVTQGTGINQPTTNTATINGLNVIRFDGSNDSMSNTSVPQSNRPHTYVIVARETASQTATKSLLNKTPTTTNAAALALYLTGTDPNRQSNVFTTNAYAGQKFTTTNTNIIYFKADGATSQFGINSTFLDTSTVGTTRDSGFRIASNENANGEFYNGDIAEIFYFNKALTNAERDVLILYLANKWGIAI